VVAVVDADDATSQRLDRLQQRLRAQGVALREARDELIRVREQAATAAAQAQAELRSTADRALAEAKVLRERLAAEQTRAQRTQEQLDRVRDVDRSGRAAADRRLDLLLQTVEGAATGLRREWQLTGGGPDPAERVAAGLTDAKSAPAGDTASLLGWLSMPQAHLIVDGYNVTKRAWPDLTLAEQRDRLVRELARLHARSGAEITVVFDGAAVIAPQLRARGVRVLFSPPGTIADEVIRRLVAAEPTGRVVLVATADREILDAVLRRAARPVPPAVLLDSLRSEDRLRP
jgi:predicted RNA-binding protein with PIN domain